MKTIIILAIIIDVIVGIGGAIYMHTLQKRLYNLDSYIGHAQKMENYLKEHDLKGHEGSDFLKMTTQHLIDSLKLNKDFLWLGNFITQVYAIVLMCNLFTFLFILRKSRAKLQTANGGNSFT